MAQRLLFICGGGDMPATSETCKQLYAAMHTEFPQIQVELDHCNWPSFQSMTITASMEHVYNTYFSPSSPHWQTPSILMCHSLGFKVGYALIRQHPELVTSGTIHRLIALNGAITWKQGTIVEYGDNVFDEWKRTNELVLSDGTDGLPRRIREYCQWSDMVEHGYDVDQPVITNPPVTFITGTQDTYIPSQVAQQYIIMLKLAGNSDATIVTIPGDHYAATKTEWQTIMKSAKDEQWFA